MSDPTDPDPEGTIAEILARHEAKKRARPTPALTKKERLQRVGAPEALRRRAGRRGGHAEGGHERLPPPGRTGAGRVFEGDEDDDCGGAGPGGNRRLDACRRCHTQAGLRTADLFEKDQVLARYAEAKARLAERIDLT